MSASPRSSGYVLSSLLSAPASTHSDPIQGTIWVSASNAIYANKFKNGIELIPGVDVAAVLASGVDRFREVVEPEQLPAVVDVSVEALWNVFTSCAIIAAVGALAVGGIRWVKMDEPGKEKKVDGEA